MRDFNSQQRAIVMEPKMTTASLIALSMLSLSFSIKLLILGILILMGSTSYAIVMLRQAQKEKRRFGRLEFFEAVFIAVFSGCMFFIASIFILDDWLFGWLAGGIGAFMGVAGVSTLGDILLTGFSSKLKQLKR